MIKAVLFDFIGTTVMETGPGLITACFEKAFADHSIPVNISLLNKDRGMDKKIIIENVLRLQQLPLAGVQDIYEAFKINLAKVIHKFRENDGTKDLLDYLRKKNINIGIGTGLERDVFDKICAHLKWNDSYFDYTGIAQETGRGRPYPDMILDMMKKINITDSNVFLKVGDTVADIREGKNANVLTAVILSGTQPQDILLHEKPDFVLHSLMDIKKIIKEKEA